MNGIARNEDKLADYRAKRSFESTPEPSGGGARRGDHRFVIQEHHARRLHWDLRLERDGVLVSWALPRGVPGDPDHNRLAVHTEDHPLDYIEFAGEIPAGSYGGGSMAIWDRGTYETEKWEDGKVVIRFEGERVRGRYALFHTRGKDWIIHRMDPPEPGDPFPDRIEPMVPTRGRLPRDDADWAFEVRWSGIRTIAYCETGHVRLEGPAGEDVTPRFRELGAIAEEMAGDQVVLDAVIAVLDQDGRPDPDGLRRRVAAESDSRIRRLQRDHPATLIAVDLLYAERADLLELAYEERRERLDALGLSGPRWQAPGYHRGDGAALLAATADRGLEGVIAKRLGSRYRPGGPRRDWRDVPVG